MCPLNKLFQLSIAKGFSFTLSPPLPATFPPVSSFLPLIISLSLPSPFSPAHFFLPRNRIVPKKKKNPLKCLLAFLLNNRLAQNISNLFIQSLSLILPLTLIDNLSSANAGCSRTTVRNGLQEQLPSHTHSRKIKCNQALVLCQAKCDFKK